MYLRSGLLHHLVILPVPSCSAVQAASSATTATYLIPRDHHHCHELTSFTTTTSHHHFPDGKASSGAISSLMGRLTGRSESGSRCCFLHQNNTRRVHHHSSFFSRHFSSSSGSSSKDGEGNNLIVTIKDGLSTPDSASDFLDQLSEEQKQLIYHTLNIEILRDKYEGQMEVGSSRQESHSFLSRFGRPATAKEDPTGTLCEVSPRWLRARLDEKAPPASASAIWAVAVKNALPFIGFGFLDNLIMILAGDYIDITIGTALGISTMAAAALGNTISDVAGIGSAWYVEGLASKIGIKDPDLTPRQMASGAVRWACNLGRAFGVTIGCLLGMVPLLFLPSVEEKKKALQDQEKKDDEVDKGKFA